MRDHNHNGVVIILFIFCSLYISHNRGLGVPGTVIIAFCFCRVMIFDPFRNLARGPNCAIAR